MIFPFAFRGMKNVLTARNYLLSNRLNNVEINSYFNNKLQDSFVSAYQEILQAIAEEDMDYLKNICEPLLYEELQASLASYKAKDYSLRYVGQNLDIDPDYEDSIANHIHSSLRKVDFREQCPNLPNPALGYMGIIIDIKGLFGLRIAKEENYNKKFLRFPGQSSQRVYFIHFADPLAVYRNQVLEANVTYCTTQRLIAQHNQIDDVIGETDNSVYQIHQLRFQSYTDNIQWVLTDIDDHIQNKLEKGRIEIQN